MVAPRGAAARATRLSLARASVRLTRYALGAWGTRRCGTTGGRL